LPGNSYPVALEGALKLKEVTYIAAEGYPAGELKHGPLALIDENVPVVVIVPSDQQLKEKTYSNIQEIKARGGKVFAVAEEGDWQAGKVADEVIEIPKVPDIFAPMVQVVPLQLLAYYTALAMGRDIDKPRNLAKSVTVE